MVMHIQTWDNGKYGCIWAVDDDDYSWKFTEIVDGCASEEDFQKSPVIASHFIGYCINNEPKGDGDIYTPFFTSYYYERQELFRKKHINDISLIRDSKRLESMFKSEHFKEERQAFEDSKVLFEFDSSRENQYSSLFLGYLEFLREKMPRYFVFSERTIPIVFQWKEFEKIAVAGYEYTEVCLNHVLDWSLGRIFASDIINGAYLPEPEEIEQVKAVYGVSDKPLEVYRIRINPTDKKKMARAIYDELRHEADSLPFKSATARQLVMEHAERWFQGIDEVKEPTRNVDVIKHQLELCLRIINDENADEHKPYYTMFYIPLDDEDILKTQGCDRHGYAVPSFYRLLDADFKNMMEAFDKWAKVYYGQDSHNTSNDEEVISMI